MTSKKPAPAPETPPPAPKKPVKRSRSGGKAVSSATAVNSKTSDIAPESPTKKKPRGKPFVKGDPRINRKGGPRHYSEARKMMQDILAEIVKSPDGKIEMSRVKIMMMDWVTSRDFRKQQHAFKVAYGEGMDNVLATFDLSTLTNAQLARLAKGEDIYTVIMKPN